MTVAKYSANGNDFVIFHAFDARDRSGLAQRLCHRHEGVGADGMIVLLPHDAYDFVWQFYNADGSEAAMCGNGSRAAAHYAFREGLAPASMRFLTGAGAIAATVDGDTVESELTPPEILRQDIEEDDGRWWLIDTGVPHLVRLCESVKSFDKKRAQELRNKYDANVNICAPEGDGLRVRTYERGVEDETLACGTGMAACFYRWHLEKGGEARMRVTPSGGEDVELSMTEKTLRLKGAVRRTFEALLPEDYDIITEK